MFANKAVYPEKEKSCLFFELYFFFRKAEDQYRILQLWTLLGKFRNWNSISLKENEQNLYFPLLPLCTQQRSRLLRRRMCPPISRTYIRPRGSSLDQYNDWTVAQKAILVLLGERWPNLPSKPQYARQTTCLLFPQKYGWHIFHNCLMELLREILWS